jgi:hypothetical protein
MTKLFYFLTKPSTFDKTFVLTPLPTHPPSFCLVVRNIYISIKIYGSYHYDYLKFYIFIFLGYVTLNFKDFFLN